MSMEAMTWVWKNSKQKGSALLALLAIADFARDDGTNSWPSIRTLAEKTRMSERSVQLIIKQLSVQGEITVGPGGGARKTNVYCVNMTNSGVQSFRGEESGQGCRIEQSGMKSGAVRGEIAIAPDPNMNPKKEPNIYHPLRLLYESNRNVDWQSCVGWNAKREAAANARLKEHPDLDDWRDAMDQLKRETWIGKPGEHQDWRPGIDYFLIPGKMLKWLEKSRSQKAAAFEEEEDPHMAPIDARA